MPAIPAVARRGLMFIFQALKAKIKAKMMTTAFKIFWRKGISLSSAVVFVLNFHSLVHWRAKPEMILRRRTVTIKIKRVLIMPLKIA